MKLRNILGLLLFIAVVILTSPTPLRAQSEFNFFVAADMHEFTGSGAYNTTSYFRGAAEKMAALDSLISSSFLIPVGDLCPVDTAGTEDFAWTIDTYLGADYPWYPVVGNHEKPGNCAVAEAYSGENLEKIGDVHSPGNGPTNCENTTVSFDHENAHFVLINEYCNENGEAVSDGNISDHLYNWLVTDLNNTDADHIFVFGHEPAFPQKDEEEPTRGGHINDSLNKYEDNRDRFWDLLAQHNADAFFSGHTHANSRYYSSNVWQMNLGHSKGLNDTTTKSTFMRVLVDGGTVTYETYRDDKAGGPYTLNDTRSTHTISSSSGSGGTISADGNVRVNHGSAKTFTFTPDPFYTVSDVKIDNVSKGTPDNYTFKNVTEDHTLSVTFRAVEFSHVYRFWSNNYKHHFYTSSTAERDMINSRWTHDWDYEKIAFSVPECTNESSPVYRFWSPKYRGHFYTISSHERDHVMTKWSNDWKYEGAVFCAYSEQTAGLKPLYRFWSDKYKGHFYTAHSSEKDTVLDKWSNDWDYEGIAYYVCP